ncbi:hypothetical protein ACFW04_007497 [Cataglyphis niger]
MSYKNIIRVQYIDSSLYICRGYGISGLQLSSLSSRDASASAEALLRRATASHVVLFTELVPSPLTSPIHSTSLPGSQSYRRRHYHTITTITTTTTSSTTARCPQQRHGDHHRTERQNERVEAVSREKEGDGECLSEDSTESVESPWNFEREKASATGGCGREARDATARRPPSTGGSTEEQHADQTAYLHDA